MQPITVSFWAAGPLKKSNTGEGYPSDFLSLHWGRLSFIKLRILRRRLFIIESIVLSSSVLISKKKCGYSINTEQKTNLK